MLEGKNSRFFKNWYNLTLKPTAEDFEKGTVEIPPENVIPHPGQPPA